MEPHRCTFGISRSPSPDAISSSFAGPVLSFAWPQFAMHVTVGLLARGAHNRDNHLSLKFIMASESMPKKRRERKKCPPMRSMLSFFPSLNFFIRYVCNRTPVYIDREYANQHDTRMFRFPECSDGKQTPTPPTPSHFRFIYDAMNSECAKMDFRFAESTVNSWTCCSLSPSLSHTRRVANRKHGVPMLYLHRNPDGTPPPATAYLYDCDDGNLFKLT